MAKPPKDPADTKSAGQQGDTPATKPKRRVAAKPRTSAAKKAKVATKPRSAKQASSRTKKSAVTSPKVTVPDMIPGQVTDAAAQQAGLWAPPVEESIAPATPVADTGDIAPSDDTRRWPGAAQPADAKSTSGTERFGTGLAAFSPLPALARGATFLEGLFGALARVRVIAAVCIAAVAMLAFTPGFTTIPPIDRDESRFAQASRQMVATGDYVDIRFQNGPRYQKPIGIYWLQSIALQVYGAEDGQAPIWVYRTVSFVGAVAAALLVYWLALAFGAPPVALAAGLLVALTILLGAEARLAKTDAMLLASILVAQGVLARAFIERRDSAVRPWHAAAFWTASAVGVLIKGPILLMVVGTTAALACLFERKVKWLRRLRPGLGIMWMLILTLPWFIAIGITSAGEFYELSIGRDLFEKIGQSRERPFVPPGAFTFGFFPSLGWPLAPLAFLAIPFAIASWHDKSTRFLVAWIVPTWVIFELAATKLPHYILPIYPALAILAARMLVYEKIPTGWLAGIAKGLFIAIPLLATIGMPIILYIYGDPISPFGVLLMLLGLIVLVFAAIYLWQRKGRASLVVTVVGTLLLYQGAFGFHVPSARTIWITPQLVTALDSARCEDPELATLGYNEPSLVLMTRTDLRLLGSGEAAAQFLAGGGCRAVFVERRFVEEMTATLATTDITENPSAATVRLLASVEGLNINGGDELAMQVFVAGEGPSTQ